MSEFLNILTQYPSTQSIFGFTDVFVNLLMAIVCSLIINWVYQKSHRSIAYSESFLILLIMMCALTSIVMMIIGSNIARAFSLVGALSIIRFRTAVKDARDTGYIFFAIAMGMAVGTGFYIVALSTTVLLAAIIWILDQTGYGQMRGLEHLLLIETKSTSTSESDLIATLKEHTRYQRLVHTDLLKEGGNTRLTFTIFPKEESSNQKILAALQNNSAVKSVKLISGLQDNLIL